jgi:hypothetical protein
MEAVFENALKFALQLISYSEKSGHQGSTRSFLLRDGLDFSYRREFPDDMAIMLYAFLFAFL